MRRNKRAPTNRAIASLQLTASPLRHFFDFPLVAYRTVSGWQSTGQETRCPFWKNVA